MTPPARRILLLDAGGILVSEPVPTLLKAMADDGGTPPEIVKAFYDAHSYPRLWAGQIDRTTFWDQLISVSHANGSPASWDQFFVDQLHTLAACQWLLAWRELVDEIAILSNHDPTWLRLTLGNAGLTDSFGHILISGETGLVKPGPEAFADAVRRIGPGRYWFVDDRPVNVHIAATCGMAAILGAEDSTAWCDEVTRRLTDNEALPAVIGGA